MGGFFDQLEEKQIEFIAKQHLFFVASAPKQGRINLSPKGIDTFRCLDPRNVAYLDFTGSGNETCAHILADGRLTFMFCSFDKRPNILRLYGRGGLVFPTDKKWPELRARFGEFAGVRQIITMQIESVQTSCGYGLPIFQFIENWQPLE